VKREQVRILARNGDLGEAAQQHVFLAEEQTLAAFDKLDGKATWSAELRLLGEQLTDLAMPSRDDDDDASSAQLWCDGQTAVALGKTGLFAIGMLSGRRLWGVGYEEPDTANLPLLRQRLAAVGNGRLYYAPRRGVLACASLVDASDLLWERVLYNERLDKIHVADDYCITMDAARRRVTVYAAENGRRYCALEFEHPEEEAPLELAYVRGQLVGPKGAQTVACYSARTGELNWSKQTPAPIGWIFKPGEDYVGVVCVGGQVMLIDVLGGEVVLDVNVPQVAEGFAEGRLHGDALLLLAANETSPRGDEPALISLDRKTGAVRWTHEHFGATGANRFAHARLLDVAEDVMPMFRRAPVDSDLEFKKAMGEVVVELYDKDTGERVGPAVRTNHSASIHEGLTGEFGLWPGRFIVGAHNSLLVLPIEWEPAAAAPPAREGAGS
jgi:outer membrane protein assembly factor BamB